MIQVDKDFFEDCFCMSYRYCIGTTAACTHADTLLKYSKYLSDERKQFNAKDIRHEISSCLNFRQNVLVTGFNDDIDAYTLLYKYLIEHSEIKDDTKYKFHIDLYKKEVNSEPYNKGGYITSIIDECYDMTNWIHLANSLDSKSHIRITTNYNNEVKTHMCVEAPVYNYDNKRIKFVYKDITDNRGYLAEKYIIKIEKQ